MADWALTADLPAPFSKRLGYSQDTLAREHVAMPFARVLNFFFKRTFSHFSFDFQYFVYISCIRTLISIFFRVLRKAARSSFSIGAIFS